MKYRKKTNLNEPSVYILLALITEPLSGYDIAKKVSEITEERLEIKTGIMYPTLSSLSNLGYIELAETIEEERNKKIYKITEQGQKAVEQEMERLQTMLKEIKTAIEGGRPYE